MPLVNGKFTELELFLNTQECCWIGQDLGCIVHCTEVVAAQKTWSMAAVCIEIALRKRTRFLFTREIQLTIKQSATNCSKIQFTDYGYGEYFNPTDNKITCKLNDSFFVFMGLKDLNKNNVKSIEGINICVVCEAQDLTKESFEVLDPTIRQDGGEIWLQFNPQFEDDFVISICVMDPRKI